MITTITENLDQSQKDYLDLIMDYRGYFENKLIDIVKIAQFLDEVKCFWLKRLDIIEFEIEELTQNSTCFLLSGAIYLNVKNYEHYYFKTFGDFHLLVDPFLKMESFFRINESKIDTKETINYFKKVYNDAISILTKYKGYFYILPIREIVIKDDKKHLEFLNEVFYQFISNIFKLELKNNKEFSDKFNSYEEIEECIPPNFRTLLIFNEDDAPSLPLRSKIENYQNTQINFLELVKNKSEAEIFLLVFYSWIIQIIEILSVCISLGITPYIRFSTTFHYLILIMHNFTKDEVLKKMIEKTIIFYIFTVTIEKDRFYNIEFIDYFNRIKDIKLLSKIETKMHEDKINILDGGVKQLQKIILDDFVDILE